MRPPNDSIHGAHEPGHCGILVLVDLMNAFSLGGSEPVRPRADIRTALRQRGHYPINHTVVIKDELIGAEGNPRVSGCRHGV